MQALSEYYTSLGFSPSEWHVGPEHPRLEEYAIDLLRRLPGGRVLEVGYQAGGFAVPVILASHQRPDFAYTGIDSGAYKNAVSGDVIARYLDGVGTRPSYAFHTGDAGAFLRSLADRQFDMILIDHFKPLYPREFHTVVTRGLLSDGGVVLLHDVLGNATREWAECRQICEALGYEWEVTDEVPQGLAIVRRGGAPKLGARVLVEARHAYRELRALGGRLVRGARA